MTRPTSEVYGELQEKYLHLAPVQGTNWPITFSHLSTYGALYFSYLQCQGERGGAPTTRPARPSATLTVVCAHERSGCVGREPKVFAANIWSRHLAHDPFSRETGMRLRRDLFEPGGTVVPSELLDRLLGPAIALARANACVRGRGGRCVELMASRECVLRSDGSRALCVCSDGAQPSLDPMLADLSAHNPAATKLSPTPKDTDSPWL